MAVNGHDDHGLTMDLGSAMHVDVGVGLDVSVGNALNTMENQMPMDVDLFGDPLHMQEISSPTTSKQLQQRLDELRGRGCCQ
jgi:mediator of RNA polymerase II transcription subunit 16